MIVSPPPLRTSISNDEYTWTQWFLALFGQVAKASTIVYQSNNPTTSQIAAGEWLIVKNTSSGALKLWANDNGTLKSVTLT